MFPTQTALGEGAFAEFLTPRGAALSVLRKLHTVHHARSGKPMARSRSVRDIQPTLEVLGTLSDETGVRLPMV